ALQIKIYLVKNELQERKATVLEISSKYLRRYRKCFEEFPRKFPDSKNLWSFPGFNLDGTVNLEPMKRLAQRDERGIKEIMAMYDQKIIPIYMLAKLRGVSEFVVMNYYGYHSELKIKTCFGTVDEWNHAVMAANNAERFVLDMTSLVTLLLLDDDFWTSLPNKLVISEETYNRLNNIEAAREDYTNEGGYVSCENEKLSFTPKNASQVKVEQERVKHFIEQVNKHCDIVSGISLAEISTAKRKILTDNIGQANAETIVLASRSGSVLWTDDLALACIANLEFGCKRIWSQIVINMLNKDIVPELNLQLYKYGYTFTKIGLGEFKQALAKSKWQVNKSPLEELISIFSDSSISTESIASLFANFIKYIWQNTTEFTAQQITLHTLNELSKRQLGFSIIKTIPIDALFGLDIINANKAMSAIRNWLRISVVGLH
ncbi:MAG: hypothetical protein KAJ46_01605, partial [Sedimentisphaerales bacterium]|nr:hypothetical protein [Sedimentisphaerales bacterium]